MSEGKNYAQVGDLAQLIGLSHKHFIIRLSPGQQLQTHRGIIYHDDLIGRPWGSQVFSHIGRPFFLLQPSLSDIIRDLPRNTQIMYPKDIGFILLNMDIGPGKLVLEAGTGSGALTIALAHAVYPTGQVVTYEIRPEAMELAKKNLARLGLDNQVVFRLKDIADGFQEQNADALFLDLPNPEDYLQQVRAALKTGGFFGSILPTVNQVERLIAALREQHFAFIEVCEILLRYYKPAPGRLRPTDRMVAHTGYLIFARPITQVEKAIIEGDHSIIHRLERSL